MASLTAYVTPASTGLLPWTSRRPDLVRRVGERPPLIKGERVLAAERDKATGTRVVATREAVYYTDPGSVQWWHRLGWEQIERVDWDATRGELRLASLLPESAPDVALRLDRRMPLVDLARERVTATTLARAQLQHGGSAAGWVVARRSPAGEVTWVVRLLNGVDPLDAAVQASVDAAIRRLGVHIGL